MTTREQAFHYVDNYIAQQVLTVTPATRAAHVVDLGCGVAASLCYLAERLPITGTGITVSSVQASIARNRIDAAGLQDRVTCLEGDYCDLPPGIASADVAFAIESFVHGPDPARFFEQCRQLVRPGGLLIICDDFQRPTTAPEAARTVEQFCRGWHVNSLLGTETLRAMAGVAGFGDDATIDLSPWLDIGRPRDRAIALFLSLIRWLPIDASRFDPVSGGSALQTCLAKGWIGYDLVVFRRAI